MRVRDRRGRDGDSLDYVIGTTANRPDRYAMPTRACPASESDACAGVDGKAVILIFDIGARDDNVSAASNIESIGIMTQCASVSGRVVNGDLREGQARGSVDGEALHWCVLDVQASDA